MFIVGRGGTECSLHTNSPGGGRFSQNIYDNNGKYLTLAITCPSIQRLLLFEIRVCKDKLALRVMASFHSIEHLTL